MVEDKLKDSSKHESTIRVLDGSQFMSAPLTALAGVNRKWLHINQHGKACLVEVDKHKLVQDLGVRYRDLISLDPSVPIPYPASLLIREKALVVNLETIRMIICANQVYVLSVPKEAEPRLATVPTPPSHFVTELCRVLRSAAEESRAALARPSCDYFGLPYELRALEFALDSALRSLDREVAELEAVAEPAIERMAQSVSRRVLEEVRAAKAVTAKLIGRVSRIKQEIEDVLEDDADMQDMYLGRRAALEHKQLPPQPPATPGPRSPRSFANLLAVQRLQDEQDKQQRGAEGGVEEGDGEGPGGEARAQPALQHFPSTGVLPEAGEARPGRGPSAIAGAEVPYDWHDWQQEQEQEQGRQGLGQMAPGGALGLQQGSGGDGNGSSSGSIDDGTGGAEPPLRFVEGHDAGGDESDDEDARSTASSASGSSGGGSPEAAAGRGGGREGHTARRHVGGSGRYRTVQTRGAESGSEIEGDGDGEGESRDSAEEVVEETVVDYPSGALVDPHDIEEAEDLLEVHFMRVDYLLARLMLLKERTDDTEDLVNIEMDHRRNELVALDLFVTCVTAAFTFVAMVAGIFGMNLWNSSWENNKGVFIWVMVMTGVLGLGMLVLIMLYIRQRRLMFISSAL